MGVSETVDSRVRRALLRISAGQVIVQFCYFMPKSIGFDSLVRAVSFCYGWT